MGPNQDDSGYGGHISTEPRINERIRVPEVRLVGPSGEQVGIVSINDALRLAQEADLDLVEVAPTARPPVCKLMDYGKFKYESALKARESRKNQAQTVIKEIKIRPKIDPHDYGTKKGHVERFLKAGDKVKVTIMFRGREQSRPELGYKLLQRLAGDVEELGFVESQPKQDGRNMIMVIGPHRKKADAKPVKTPERASARASAPIVAASREEIEEAMADTGSRPLQAPQAVASSTQFSSAPASSAQASSDQAGSAQASPEQAGSAQASPAQGSPAQGSVSDGFAAAAPPSRPAQSAAPRSAAPSAGQPAPGSPRPAAPRPGPRPATAGLGSATPGGTSGQGAVRPAVASSSGSSAPKPGPAPAGGPRPAPPRPGPAGGPRPAAPRPTAPKPGPVPSGAPRPAAPKPSAPRATATKDGEGAPVPTPRPRSAENGGSEAGG
jgi:translation initiation factor IF-3